MSELQNTITEAVKTAMKARQMDQVKVLRNLQAAIKQVQIDGGKDLKDADILQILQKQVKQRNESLAIYQKNGRDDLAQKEQFEINVISNFLPTPLSDDDILIIVTETVAKLGASGMKDMGQVMSVVKEQTLGLADPAVVSGVVKKVLTA
ncbi:MAG: GatB/YqeY domain-containing protein [Moraxella sp.]|nr:MAG: GatB/YqeY domain-containing protein [Moraxella sp.]